MRRVNEIWPESGGVRKAVLPTDTTKSTLRLASATLHVVTAFPLSRSARASAIETDQQGTAVAVRLAACPLAEPGAGAAGGGGGGGGGGGCVGSGPLTRLLPPPRGRVVGDNANDEFSVSSSSASSSSSSGGLKSGWLYVVVYHHF